MKRHTDMKRQTDRWMDKQTDPDGQDNTRQVAKDRKTDKKRWTDRWMNIRTDRQTDRQAIRQTDRQVKTIQGK